MSNILILEPNYSAFEQEVACYLSQGHVYSLLFNLGYGVYLYKTRCYFAHYHIKNYPLQWQDAAWVQKLPTLFTQSLQNYSNRYPTEFEWAYQLRYVAFLRDFLQRKQIDWVLMHNDLRWQHALAIALCKQMKIPYFVTEFGIFRPDTITVDSQGVNAYSQIPRYPEFYQCYQPETIAWRHYPLSFWRQIKVYGLFGLFLLGNAVGHGLRINSPLRNKQYSIWRYFKLFIRQLFRKWLSSSTEKLSEKTAILFVPLQVESDSQVLVHSQFYSMQAFIDSVQNAYFQLPTTLQARFPLVFKIHPMEQGVSHYQFHPQAQLSQLATKELIAQAALVVTINSTVGFEAICQYKPVLTLGAAFYNIPGITLTAKETLAETLQAGLEGEFVLDRALIDKFIAYLKYEYQINGNIYYYDQHTLQAVKRLIQRTLDDSLS